MLEVFFYSRDDRIIVCVLGFYSDQLPRDRYSLVEARRITPEAGSGGKRISILSGGGIRSANY